MLSNSGSDFYEERKCDVYMRVTYRTNFSQELRIVGNIRELGSWSISASKALETDVNSYPVWVNKFPLKLARGKTKKFKKNTAKNKNKNAFILISIEANKKKKNNI